MLVKTPPRWEIPEREAAPESSYHSRRTVLKALGFVGLESLGLQARDPHGPYPAKRSPKYRLDRPITPQWAATGYNNFYEFTLRKERVNDMVGRFTIGPWTVQGPPFLDPGSSRDPETSRTGYRVNGASDTSGLRVPETSCGVNGERGVQRGKAPRRVSEGVPQLLSLVPRGGQSHRGSVTVPQSAT